MALATSFLVIWAGAQAPHAAAASEIGAAVGGFSTCGPGTTWVQAHTGPTSPSFAVPAGGVIVAWKVEAFELDDTVQLKVLRPTAATTDFVVVGESAMTGLPGIGLQQFPARIPVQAGDRLGFTAGPTGFAGCMNNPTDPADVVRTRLGATAGPQLGSTFVTDDIWTPWTLNLSATVEPDADGDGFGDETQDGCATASFTQSACDTIAPATKIGKRPKKKTKKRVARFGFTADEPETTFACKLDRKPFKSCAAPYKKNVKVGRHTFAVAATDRFGNVDPSPAKYSWKVLD